MRLGQHLLIECRGQQAMLDSDNLKALMTRAALAGGATVLYDHFHQFGGHGGITGVLVLAESHITVHTWPENYYAAFDIFMCGDAQPKKAAQVIANQFPDADICIKSVDRGYPSDADPGFTVLQPSDLQPPVLKSDVGSAHANATAHAGAAANTSAPANLTNHLGTFHGKN